MGKTVVKARIRRSIESPILIKTELRGKFEDDSGIAGDASSRRRFILIFEQEWRPRALHAALAIVSYQGTGRNG